MRYRPLGASGLRVSQLFLGAMTFADGVRARGRPPGAGLGVTWPSGPAVAGHWNQGICWKQPGMSGTVT